MSRPLKRWSALILGSLMVLPACAAQAAPSPCTQLADEARRQPQAAWAQQRSPLAGVLKIERRPQGRPLAALETELSERPDLRDAIGADPARAVGVERLPGTELYKVDSVQGSANCQSTAFIEAVPGSPPRRIETPFGMTDQEIPCWTQTGDFGQVSGQPVFLVHGAETDHGLDERYRIAPWTGKAWGPSCQLRLEFRKTFRLAGQFCADAASCAAGRKVALDVARAYETSRSAGTGLAAAPFLSGRQPGAAILAAVASVHEPVFPTFAAEPRTLDVFRTGYANVEIASFPLYLGGRWLVGVAGHAGVGWRESRLTLLSLFVPGADGLTPVAGFQVELVNGGLIRATAGRDGTEQSPR